VRRLNEIEETEETHAEPDLATERVFTINGLKRWQFRVRCDGQGKGGGSEWDSRSSLVGGRL